MVILMYRVSVLTLSLIALATSAALNSAASAQGPRDKWETPPGWTETRGGAGGRVIRVTSLEKTGPGTLAEALMSEGPRVIEFSVSGTIDLQGKGLKIDHPYLTLAGETAPSPGITLVHGGIQVLTHDVIVRHLRVRTSDGPRAKSAEPSMDGLGTGGGAHDVIVDHCSFAWGTDENISASGPRFNGATPDEWRKNTSHRVTISHCIIGEGLHAHSNPKGTLIHDNTREIALIGNFYISQKDRMPLFKGGVSAAAVNNFIYNPGRRVMQFAQVPSQWAGHSPQRALLTMTGNVARKGPSSAAEMAFFEIWPAYGSCDFYLHDNLFLAADGRPLSVGAAFRDKARPIDHPDQSLPDSSGFQFHLAPYESHPEMRQVDQPPIWPPRLKARTAAETADWVLANAGARPWERDAVDRRFIEEAKSGGGMILRLGKPPG